MRAGSLSSMIHRIAIINDGEYKAFDVSEMLSVILVMTGEEISFDDLKACLSFPK